MSWADADGLLAPAAMAAVTGVVARRALVEHARMAVVAFPDSPLVRSTFVRLSARAEVAGRWRNRLLAMLLAEDAVSFAQQVAAPRHAILMTRGALHGAPLLEDAAALLSGSC